MLSHIQKHYIKAIKTCQKFSWGQFMTCLNFCDQLKVKIFCFLLFWIDDQITNVTKYAHIKCWKELRVWEKISQLKRILKYFENKWRKWKIQVIRIDLTLTYRVFEFKRTSLQWTWKLREKSYSKIKEVLGSNISLLDLWKIVQRTDLFYFSIKNAFYWKKTDYRHLLASLERHNSMNE